jgi:hypothetical protein
VLSKNTARHTLTAGGLCDALVFSAKALLLPRPTWSRARIILQLWAEVKQGCGYRRSDGRGFGGAVRLLLL